MKGVIMANTHVYKEKVVVERPIASNADISPLTRYNRYNPASRIIYFILDVIEVLLALRFVLMLLGANAANSFTNFIYNLTAPLIAPFRGIFATSSVSGARVEWTTIVAMVIYALIAYAIVKLIEAIDTPARTSY